MTKYLDIDELATLLGRSSRSIKRDMARNPSAVPPKMHVPGSALLRWRAHEVENWIVDTAGLRGRPVDNLKNRKTACREWRKTNAFVLPYEGRKATPNQTKGNTSPAHAGRR